MLKWCSFIKDKHKNTNCLTYKNSLKSSLPSRIDEEMNVNKAKNVTSMFLDKSMEKCDEKYFLEESKSIISANDNTYSDIFKDKSISTVNNKSNSIEDKQNKDIFQSIKHAQFGKNKDKDNSKKRFNESGEDAIAKKQTKEENIVNNTIIFDSILSFKTLNFDNNNDRLPNKSNNRVNLNQENSIVKTKKRREKENKKEKYYPQTNVTNNISTINNISSNDFDSISLNSNSSNNLKNNILTFEKTIREKENSSFNQKGTRKYKHNNTSNSLTSNMQSLNSNSSNNDNFKFSSRPTISEFINNDSKIRKKINFDKQEDDLLKILQKNVKEANEIKPTIGDKKKRFYENYLI